MVDHYKTLNLLQKHHLLNDLLKSVGDLKQDKITFFFTFLVISTPCTIIVKTAFTRKSLKKHQLNRLIYVVFLAWLAPLGSFHHIWRNIFLQTILYALTWQTLPNNRVISLDNNHQLYPIGIPFYFALRRERKFWGFFIVTENKSGSRNINVLQIYTNFNCKLPLKD